MWSVRTLPEFDEWLDSVRDAIWEMREHFGPGWRMYYTRRGGQVVLMLGGGDKSTQRQDIAGAKARALRIL
jgi:putative addiction module killer protein